jgi:hypothetical protein
MHCRVDRPFSIVTLKIKTSKARGKYRKKKPHMIKMSQI